VRAAAVLVAGASRVGGLVRLLQARGQTKVPRKARAPWPSHIVIDALALRGSGVDEYKVALSLQQIGQELCPRNSFVSVVK